MTNSSVYDGSGKGQLVSVSQSGAPKTLYLYDQMAEQVASVLDLDGSGGVTAGDRITSNDTRYVLDGGVCWRESTRYVGGSLVGRTRERMTGRTLDLNSETLVWDEHGSQSVTRVSLSPATRTSVSATHHRDSSADEVTWQHLGLATTTVSRTGVRTDYAYDGLRRVSAVRDGRKGWSYLQADAAGRVTNQIDAAGYSSAVAYDIAGRRVSARDALAGMTRMAYDQHGNMSRTWGSAAYPVSYGYDEYRRMTNMSTYRAAEDWGGTEWPSGASGDATRWLYDEASGLLTNKVYADGKGVAYSYTPDGRLAARTWARGIVTTYGYDLVGQLTNISYSDGTPSVAFQYDALGRMLVASNAAAWYGYSYAFGTGPVTGETAAAIDSVVHLARSYSCGRPAGIGVGVGFAVAYGYSDLGRLATCAVVTAPIPVPAFRYRYLAASDLIEGLDQDDNFDAGILNSTATREYEANRDLIIKVSAHSMAVPRAMDPQDYNSEFRYQNDGLARRTLVAEDWTTGDFWASNYWYCNYGYNARSEVASARHWLDLATDMPVTNRNRGYGYDPIGNRLTNVVGTAVVTYVANELNQYTAITGAAPIRLWYDDDGNLTNDGAFAYAWDGENRMVLAEPLGPADGAKRVRSAYDHMGRRVEKAVDTWNASASAWAGYSTNRFVYDGWNLLQEVAVLPSAVQTNWFVWGLDLSGSLQGAGGIGGLLAQVRCAEGGSDVWTYRYDANGNVCEVLGTNKHALTVAHYEYDPFGSIAQEWPPAPYAVFTNQFRFSTKYVDDETGLSYYGYRYYSPKLGRWMSRDPAEELSYRGVLAQFEQQGRRRATGTYVFVGNDVIGSVDWMGLWVWKDSKRQKDNRAVIISASGDTVSSLAAKVHLESSQSKLWMRDPDGKPVTPSQSIKPGCAYSVPNVFVIAIGGDLAAAGEWWSSWYAMDAYNKATEKGFRVYFRLHSANPFTSMDLMNWMKEDLWGLGFYGHGIVGSGEFVISKKGYTWPWQAAQWDTMPSASVPSTYKLGVVIAKLCSAYKNGWDTLVSSTGKSFIAPGLYHDASSSEPGYYGVVNGIE